MKKQRNKLLGYITFGLLIGFLAILIWWVCVAGASTVWKILTYPDSSIEDYQAFPIRVLKASNFPFEFELEQTGLQFPSEIVIGDGKVADLDNFLENTDTVAFVVIKDDVIRYERYLNGYRVTTPTLAFSMSKSFISILIGIAIDDGIIESVDQPVTDYVPELKAAGYDRVTLRHLLQMTSGMDYVEVEGNPLSLHTRFYYTDRLEHELINLDLLKEPGTEFSYKTGENALLGLILSRALGDQTITKYTQEKLWTPLGMESSGGWNLDHPDGLEKTWCCLSATARDYAKFGRLYLNNGNWNGKQVISSEWVKQSTAIDTQDGSIWNYQYQWWLVSEGGNDYIAMGHQGQFVYVNPDKKIIIVRLGTSLGGLEWDEWKVIFSSLAQALDE